MAQLGRTKNVAVAFIGKVKTAAQMTAIIALLLWEPLIPGIPTPILGTVALWVAAILTLWSMFHYLRLAAPHLAPDNTADIRTTTTRREPQAGPGTD
jgi:CDP-diacylglycerol--glycerol-3-phosphate 3-phosphatidyltransferase/cardiolipin synthase